MSKVAEFLNKVAADEAAKAEFDAVTLDEVKDFFSGNGRELSEEELAGVAGGYYSEKKWSFSCPLCRKKILENGTFYFDDGALIMDSDKQHAQHEFKHHLRLSHPDLFGCKYPGEADENIAEQKAEELMKPEWEEFVKWGEYISRGW